MKPNTFIKQGCMLMCLTPMVCSFNNQAQEVGAQHQLFANVLLRYENETGSIGIADRERLRMIARAGLKSNWNETFSSTVRFSYGLKNKQNVPAVTLHRFSDQPLPDKNLYLDQAYITAKLDKVSVKAGKIPWGSKQITDVFWDRDLNPIGLSADWSFNKNHKLHTAFFQPLDGNSGTVGDMSIVQLQSKFKLGEVELGLMPWLVNYTAESGALYAKKDTDIDNRFLRLSTYIKKGKWRLGLDYGKGDPKTQTQYRDQDSSYALELRHGGLKKPGDLLAQFTILKVEKYAVVTEFAQNGTARYATSNIEGWDLRVRKRLNKQWWLGMRYSDTETIVGAEQSGKRFRIETKYTF